MKIIISIVHNCCMINIMFAFWCKSIRIWALRFWLEKTAYSSRGKQHILLENVCPLRLVAKNGPNLLKNFTLNYLVLFCNNLCEIIININMLIWLKNISLFIYFTYFFTLFPNNRHYQYPSTKELYFLHKSTLLSYILPNTSH